LLEERGVKEGEERWITVGSHTQKKVRSPDYSLGEGKSCNLRGNRSNSSGEKKIFREKGEPRTPRPPKALHRPEKKLSPTSGRRKDKSYSGVMLLIKKKRNTVILGAGKLNKRAGRKE